VYYDNFINGFLLKYKRYRLVSLKKPSKNEVDKRKKKQIKYILISKCDEIEYVEYIKKTSATQCILSTLKIQQRTNILLSR